MICSEANHTAIVKCNGCQQHIGRQERLLNEQLDWLTVDHDDLRRDILEQISTPKYHPSMILIDQWEKQAIEHIRHTAVLTRRALIDALDQHMLEVEKILNTLTPKLREARQYRKCFSDTDIQEWATTLHELKKIPIFPVAIDEDNNIHGIVINSERQYPTTRFKPKVQSLVSTIHDLTAADLISKPSKGQAIHTEVTEIPDANNKTVELGDVSSKRSHNITPRGVLIIREQENNETAASDIHQADEPNFI